MAKWLDIPNWGYAGTSDSQCVDANAGIDITELTLLSMQAGSNLNHDIGYLDFGLTGAGELVVMTDEVISMNRRTLEGIEVTDETLGLDVIAAAGHGGDFLRSRHTKKFVRGQQWKPTLLNRDTQKNWEAGRQADGDRQGARQAARHHGQPRAAAAAGGHEGHHGQPHRRVRRRRQGMTRAALYVPISRCDQGGSSGRRPV